MCTLAVAFQTDRRWPLVVAANRDERSSRPSETWALREPRRGVRYAAPRDLLGGGTWIGISARGVFSALTNYYVRTGGFPDPSRRTRGALVPSALEQPDAAAARRALEGEDPTAYNPFNFLVADAHVAFLWWYDGQESGFAEFAPGLHVITNRAHDDRVPRGELVRARWPLELDVGRLRDVLTIHGPGREATCFHTEPFGTQSATVLRIAPSLAASELYVSDVRPCMGPLEDRSALLHALAASA
jgi:uncharacterized protein with NRDE domain